MLTHTTYSVCNNTLTGVGVWHWGTRIKFLRFPPQDGMLNPVGNTAHNTQILIQLLDDVEDAEDLRISSYLHGHTGFKQFRELVTKLLTDARVVDVL